MKLSLNLTYIALTIMIFFCLHFYFYTSLIAQEPEDNDLIDLDVRDADIRQVLLNISSKAKLNLILSPKVQGKITCRVTRMNAKELIEFIARANGFELEDNGRIMIIYTERPSGSRVHVEIISLQNASAENTAKIIQNLKLDKRAKVTHDSRTNRLIIVYEY